MAATAMFRAARAGVVRGARARASRSLPAHALTTPKESSSLLEQKAFFRPELYISSTQAPLADDRRPPAEPGRAGGLRRPARRRRIADARVHRSALGRGHQPDGRVPAHPRPRRRQPRDAGDARRRRSGATSRRSTRRSWPRPRARSSSQYRDVLGIDVAQLGAARATQVTADLWQVSIPQAFQGVPVRHGRLAATISHGNLVLIGTETWGNVSARAAPSAGVRRAGAGRRASRTSRAARATTRSLRQPTLEMVPFAPPELQEGEGFAGPVGHGLRPPPGLDASSSSARPSSRAGR